MDREGARTSGHRAGPGVGHPVGANAQGRASKAAEMRPSTAPAKMDPGRRENVGHRPRRTGGSEAEPDRAERSGAALSDAHPKVRPVEMPVLMCDVLFRSDSETRFARGNHQPGQSLAAQAAKPIERTLFNH
jgi:hypothetical protein